MTETEMHYAQIEKEMLAIVFGVERFEHYIYGRPVKVDTDHKPLEIIFKKSFLRAPSVSSVCYYGYRNFISM